ncbi:hypothetical protein AB0C52_23460 [Streptomyces sp. NPDC048717]|uniref:hypothetical protein n=1 Tax=Streptomyces sp. NPDC048717 TaxID=3154928 RepID=UPI0034173C8B
MTQHIRIASRASAMATAQVNQLMEQITRTNPAVVPEFVPITTAGDSWTGPLSEVGGKGAFTSSVAQAVLDGRADLALHCAKDMPGDEPEPDGTLCVCTRRATPSTTSWSTRPDANSTTSPPVPASAPPRPAGSPSSPPPTPT